MQVRHASLSFIVALVNAFDQSFSDCQTFVSLWPNTCQSGPVSNADLLSQSGSNVRSYTCTGDDSWCVGQSMTQDLPSASCSHDSYMCLACLTANGETKIRVQSNNMPNSCWQTNTSNPNVADYVNVDFRVTWNADMTSVENYQASDFASGSDIDNVLCDIQRTSSASMHSTITYVEVGSSTSMSTWSGISKNNIALYNGLALGNQDAVLLEGSTMDGCLGHASPNNNAQHAHSVSPCVDGSGVTGSTTTKPKACNTGDIDCFPADNSYMMGTWTAAGGRNFGGIYGLARDGHVIFGPYNSDGEVWTCDDVDMCNGFFLSDGSYGYASTTFFPYMVGCWGPAPSGRSFMPSCTTNGCGQMQAGSAVSTVSLSLAVLALALNQAL